MMPIRRRSGDTSVSEVFSQSTVTDRERHHRCAIPVLDTLQGFIRVSADQMDMSQHRDERGQFTEEVTVGEVLDVFEAVEGPVITSSDVATATGCSRDSARRKLNQLYDRRQVGRRKASGRILYWRRDASDPNPVDPEDPIFTDRSSFESGREDLSERVDAILYGPNS